MYEEWKNRRIYTKIKPKTDMLLVSFVSMVIVMARYLVRKKIACVIINSLQQGEDEKEKFRTKFEGSLFRFFYYMYSLCFEIFILSGQDWVFSPIKYTFDWPNSEIPLAFKLHHLVQLCYYLTNIFFLFLEPRLKDFYQMLFHHIITVFLISMGFFFNMIRYGLIVMIIHDSANPFLEFAKLNLYAKNTVISNVFFVTFAFIFIILRLVVYPSIIILPAIYFTFCYHKMLLFSIITVLILLFIVNAIWARYIVKMAKEMLSNRKIDEDIRERKKKD